MEESRWALSCSGHQWDVVVAPGTHQQVAVFQNKKVSQVDESNKRGGYRALSVRQALLSTVYTEHFIEPSQQLYEVITITILVLHVRRV